jgi:hypothetical protein
MGTCLVNAILEFMSSLSVYDLVPKCKVRFRVEAGSPCAGESHQGKASLHRARQGRMSPCSNPGQVVSSDVPG